MTREEPNPVTFAEGDLFSSYSDLEKKISAYEKARAVQLVRRDCRLLEAARKRIPKRVEGANENLRYFSMHFACVFGGKKYQAKGKGIRPNQSTVKQGCPAAIKLTLSKDGQHLQVTECREDHNHEIIRDVYEHLPKQRKLSDEQREKAAELLQLRANKKLVQHHLSRSTGKPVTLKDLSNVRGKKQEIKLANVVTKLQEIEGSSVELFTEDGQEMSGLFFQDSKMKRAFASFPEVLALDATYKLNNLRMPLYVFLAIDGDGQSEIVAICLTANESMNAIRKIVECFKKNNPNWASTAVIMTDKDLTERRVLGECFPRATLTLCLFHTFRTFRREVTCEKLKITPGERDFCLDVITKMVYARSEEEYDAHYLRLDRADLPSVKRYFDDNWHDIRAEWVDGLKGDAFTLGERTNNRLESTNAKIKSVCSIHADLPTFFNNFLKFISTIRNERNHRNLMAVAKRTVIRGSDVEEQFAEYLTPYAYNKVVKQLQLRSKIDVLSRLSPTIERVLSVRGDVLDVNTETWNCECQFNKTLKLPCCHIFAIREKKEMAPFQERGIAQRWTKDYLKAYLVENNDLGVEHSFEVTSFDDYEPESDAYRILTQHEKYRRANRFAQKLSELCSEVGMREYVERLNTMKKLVLTWSKGGRAAFVSTENADDDGSGICLDSPSSSKSNEAESTGPGDDVHEEPPQDNISDPSTEPQNISDPHQELQDNTPDSPKAASAASLTLPPKMQKRGRPKGSETTVIGLPRKKKRYDNRLQPFLLKNDKEKKFVILRWFVEEEVAYGVLKKGRKIEEKEVEMRPEFISSSCLDENVCIETVRQFFTEDAWLALQAVVEVKRKNRRWVCHRCLQEASGETVACDSCLEWFHWDCVGFSKNYKARHWFCRECRTTK